MLIGHYAPAFALKRLRPSTPLWLLFVAVQFVDYLWALFVLTGIERAHLAPGHTASNALSLDFMPYSHGLLASVAWAAAFGVVVAKARGEGRALVVVAGAAVFSHWLCDLPMHVPDLPLLFDAGPKFGWGLWNHRIASFLLEFGLVVGAAWLARPVLPRPGRWLAFVVGLAALNAFQYFGPLPGPMPLVNLSALALYTALAAWAAAVDRPLAA